MPRPKHRLRPSLDDLALFAQVFESLDADSSFSFGDIARRIGRAKATVSDAIGRLEKIYGPLVTHTRRSPTHQLKPNAHKLYWEAVALLEQYAKVKTCLRPAEERLPADVVGITHGIHVHLMTGAYAGYLRKSRDKTGISFQELDCARILSELQRGGLALGLGPQLSPQRQQACGNAVRFEPLHEDIDVVLVCHPSHPLADGAADGRAGPIALAALARERLYVPLDSIQPERHPRLPAPEEHEGGERVEIETVTTMLRHVSEGTGVGLVPGFYWLLADLARLGHIAYAPVPELGWTGIDAYLPGKNGTRMPPAVAELLKEFRRHLAALQFQPPGLADPAAQPRFPPLPLENYTYQYYVSRQRGNHVSHQWCKGEITIVQEGKKVHGRQRDRQGGKVVREFEFTGMVDPNALILNAEEVRTQEHYFAAFHCSGTGDVLIGAWTGHDDQHAPVLWAPMVLSTTPLDVVRLNHAVMNAPIKCFMNAAVGLADDAAETD